jgi:hypothetical protein
MSYTYRIYIIPVNKPVLSNIPFISFIYIFIIIKILLSFKLAGYFNSILLMLLWPIKKWPLTSFIGIKIRFIQMSITA